MNSKNQGPSKGPVKPTPDAGEPKKPSALLDLKATEVPSKDTGAKATSETKPAAAGSPPKPADPDPSLKPQVAAKPGADTKSPAPPSAEEPPKAAEPQGSGSAPKASANPSPGPQPGMSSKSAPEGRQAPVRGAGGFSRALTHIGAGVAGGFLALLLADAVGPQFGFGSTAVSVGDIEKRLAAAEQTLRQRPASEASSTAEIDKKLSALSDRLARIDDIGRSVAQLSESQTRLAADAKSLQEQVGQPQTDKETGERIAKLEQMLDTLTAAAGTSEGGGRIPQLAAITGKLSDLETALSNKLAEQRKSMTDELDARLAQSAEASEAARSATLRMDKELAASRADLARLSQRAEAFKASDDRFEQTLRTLQEEAGSLRSAVDGLKSDLAVQMKSVARTQDVTAAVAAVTTRMGALEQNLQGVVKSEADRKANAERIVLALELGNLKRALDRGGSYAQELAEVARVGGGKIDLSVLERYKDQGVPTLPDLVSSFRPVAHAVIDAASVPAEASTFDRLLQSAKSVVRIRRTDYRPDDPSVEATVSRMEKALADGQLPEVLAEARKIPAPAIDPAESWLAKLEARAAVDRALASVEEQLKSSLSGQGPVEKRVQ